MGKKKAVKRIPLEADAAEEFRAKAEARSALDATIKEWVDKAPEIRGLRRPGTRMKAVALMGEMEAKGLLSNDGRSDSVSDMADFVADIDELLATLGGEAYIDWIESVPLRDGIQVAVLIEVFSQRIAPDLGKG